MKNNLIWLDLEMTGLEVEKDTILEIAVVVTDYALNIIDQTDSIAIYQDSTVLKNMNQWSQEHHLKSGLLKRVQESKISLEDAENICLEFMEEYEKEGQSPICGNSVHQDRLFLKKYMENLHDFFHYRNLDVSSIKILSQIWHTNYVFKKKNNHTALSDIIESIEELKFYRNVLFKI